MKPKSKHMFMHVIFRMCETADDTLQKHTNQHYK